MHRLIYISSAMLIIIWLILAGITSSIYTYLIAALLVLGVVVYNLIRNPERT